MLSARTLANIAVHKTYRRHMVEHSIVPALLSLTISKHPAVRLCSIRILCSLSRDRDGALAILRADGLGTLNAMARGLLEPGGASAYTPVRSLKVDEGSIRLKATIVDKHAASKTFKKRVRGVDPQMTFASYSVSKIRQGGVVEVDEEDDDDDDVLGSAVTKIQSRYRGQKQRRATQDLKSKRQSAGWFTQMPDRDNARIPRIQLEKECVYLPRSPTRPTPSLTFREHDPLA